MKKKTQTSLIVMVVLLIALFSLFGVPLIFSVVTGVPYWFLLPFLHTFSIGPPERSMYLEVTPKSPTTLGETITVRVVDLENKTPLEGAKIEALKDGGLSINKTTDAGGLATFPYMGATTVIYASRDGYANADPVVIPQIPDWWVTTRNNNYIASMLSALTLIVTTVGVFRKLDSEPKRRMGKRAKTAARA